MGPTSFVFSLEAILRPETTKNKDKKWAKKTPKIALRWALQKTKVS